MNKWAFVIGIVTVLCAATAGVRAWEARVDSDLSIQPRCLANGRNMDRSVPWAYLPGPGWLYVSPRAITDRYRLVPGDVILGVQRESMAAFERSVIKKSYYSPCTILPAHQVWVVRVRFSRPRQIISARFASGVATYVYDAVNGRSVEGVIKGKFLSGPPFLRKRTRGSRE